ncbi:MAG TPA: DUF378 domain-containing protein [Candidatus Saccharimonadales bacterium]|nr:DUF378 domain-containing protein [Candidatus Saccharimonadales bacterium]
MKIVGIIALVLVLIGGLNWGLVGFFEYNLVEGLFGAGTILTRILYDLVGLSALYLAIATPMLKSRTANEQL